MSTSALHHRARFIGPMDRILYLRSLPMFGRRSFEFLARLADHLEERHFRQGQVVAPADRPVDSVYFIVSGQVRTTYKGSTIAVVQPPYGLGFAAALSRVADSYEAIAEVDTQTLRLDRDVFLNLMEDDFSFTLATIRWVTGDVLRARDQLPPKDSDEEEDSAHLPSYPGQPLNLVERLVWMVRSSSVFANSNIDSVMAICRRQSERRWQDGERLWSKGDLAPFGLSILKGAVHCWGDEDQREFTGGVGFGVGYLDGLAGNGRYLNARAQGELIALVDDIETLVDVFEDNFSLASDLLATLCATNLEIGAMTGPDS